MYEKNAEEYLFNEAIKYLGKYPATKKKIEEYLKKKLEIKKFIKKLFFQKILRKIF